MDASRPSACLRWIERTPAPRIALLLFACIVAVAAADAYSTADIGFTLAYLLPIALAAWRLGAAAAVVTVLVCGLTWFLVHLWERALQVPPAIEAMNLIMELGVFLAFGLLLAQLHQRLDEAQRLARTDSLTAVANRRAFREQLGHEIERCRRFGQSFTLAYIDVDGFKAVNDRLGHQSGDELLQAVAHTLANGIRKVDLAARLGGDEFALLLPGTDGVGAAVLMARLRAVLDAGLRQTFGVSCSIGCLTVVRDAPTVDALIAAVDQLMYAVKNCGRGLLRHELWPAGIEPAAMSRPHDRAAN